MTGGCSEVEEKGNLIFLHINFILLQKREKKMVGCIERWGGCV